jgi:hypothetical protein
LIKTKTKRKDTLKKNGRRTGMGWRRKRKNGKKDERIRMDKA